jgi:hypothetical protein
MAAIYYKVKINGKWLFRTTKEECECKKCRKDCK